MVNEARTGRSSIHSQTLKFWITAVSGVGSGPRASSSRKKHHHHHAPRLAQSTSPWLVPWVAAMMWAGISRGCMMVAPLPSTQKNMSVDARCPITQRAPIHPHLNPTRLSLSLCLSAKPHTAWDCQNREAPAQPRCSWFPSTSGCGLMCLDVSRLSGRTCQHGVAACRRPNLELGGSISSLELEAAPSLGLPSSLFRVSLRGRTAEKEEEQLTTHCRQHARPPSQGSRP